MADKDPNQTSCTCGAVPKVVLACSGASDVGQITDLAARKLAAEGAATMLALAGISGRVSGILASAEAAPAGLAIDGCPLDCARKILEQVGLGRFEHLRLSDLGMERGQSSITDARIENVVNCARMRLGGQVLPYKTY